jgi:predicted PurR-regulated permease PerM
MNKEQSFLLLLLFLSSVVSLLIVLPLLQYILGAILVAYVLYPITERVRPVVGPRLAPLFIMVGAVTALFVPVGYLTFVLVRDLVALSEGETGLQTGEIEAFVFDVTGQQVDLTESVTSLSAELLGLLFTDVSAAVSFGLELSVGFMLLLFVVYYLLRDGDALVEWIIDVAPMENSVCTRLFDRIDKTTWGVVVGHLFVAVLQGLVGGLGLFVAGVPNTVFWTFAMIVLALLPLIGAFLVWAPAATYLLAVGQTNAGVFLFVYGAIVVSLVDNYARPLFIDREAHLNPAVVLVGVFGGTYAIGVTGLFLGPVILAVFVATITAFDEEYDALATYSRESPDQPEHPPDQPDSSDNSPEVAS